MVLASQQERRKAAEAPVGGEEAQGQGGGGGSPQGPQGALHAPEKFTAVACLALKGPYDGLPPLYTVAGAAEATEEPGGGEAQGQHGWTDQ